MEENNTIVNNNLMFILSLFGFIIILSIVLLIYFNERNMSSYVHYSNCYQPVSDYSVEPDKTSSSILRQCGPDKTQSCSLTVENLGQAITYAQQNNASKFAYDETTKTALLIDPVNTIYVDNKNSSIYTQNRFNVNQASDNSQKKDTEGNFNTSLTSNVIQNSAIKPTTTNYSTIAVNS